MSEAQETTPTQAACEVCHRAPGADGITLHNVSPTGVPWMWRCDEHLLPAHRLILRERGVLPAPKGEQP